MNHNVIITCAVTGAGDTVDKHPAIPVTPAQIAATAVEAAQAGATAASYTHLRAHETVLDLVCRLLLEKKTHTRTE
mgnify:CR=1 FL=1